MENTKQQNDNSKQTPYRIWSIYASKPVVELADALMSKLSMGRSQLFRRALEALAREGK